MGNRRDRERAKQAKASKREEEIDAEIGTAVDGMMEAIDMHTFAQSIVPRYVSIAWYRSIAQRCTMRADVIEEEEGCG